MDWYRRYHGTCADPKIRLVARAAKVPTPYAIAAWDAVLEHASAHDDRGSVEGMSVDLLAVTIDCDEDEAARLLAAFTSRQMLIGGRVAAWEKRQSPSDSSTERTRKWRERRKAEASGAERDATRDAGDVVTERHGDVTETPGDVKCDDVTGRVEQNRVDKILSPPPAVGPPSQAAPVRPAPAAETDPELPLADEPPEPVPKRKAAAAHGTRLHPQWEPDEDDVAYARQWGFVNGQLNRVTEQFRNHWLGEAGQRARKADWHATWRKWIVREAERLGPARAAAPNGQAGHATRRDERPGPLTAAVGNIMSRRGLA